MIVLCSHELIYTFICTKITDSDEFCQPHAVQFQEFLRKCNSHPIHANAIRRSIGCATRLIVTETSSKVKYEIRQSNDQLELEHQQVLIRGSQIGDYVKSSH